MEYTLEDFKRAEDEAKRTQEAVEKIQRKQARARGQIEERLRRLRQELSPVVHEADVAADRLRDIRARLLGPWVLGQGFPQYSGSIYVPLPPEKTPEWYHNRVWLRRVGGTEPLVWQVRIQNYVGPGGGDYVLGTAVRGQAAMEFERHKMHVEKMLVEMGYILQK